MKPKASQERFRLSNTTGQSCLPLLRQGCSLSASTESLRELTAGSLRLDCLLYSRSTLVCGYCVSVGGLANNGPSASARGGAFYTPRAICCSQTSESMALYVAVLGPTCFGDTVCLAVPGAPSIVGTGDIFGDRFVQPIHVLRRGVRLSKRHCDASFVEGIEDGESEIRARATTFVEVINKRVEFKVQSVCAEIKINGRRRRRHDVGIVLRDLEQNGHDLVRIAAVTHVNWDQDAASVIA